MPPSGVTVKLNNLIQTLHAVKRGKEWLALCPAHDDHSPSLSITLSNDDKILVHCLAGCEQDDVISCLKAMDIWPSGPNGHDHDRQYFGYGEDIDMELAQMIKLVATHDTEHTEKDKETLERANQALAADDGTIDYRTEHERLIRELAHEEVTRGKDRLAETSRLNIEPTDRTEASVAALSPNALVKDYLFEEIRMLAGIGGVGKSILCLYESVHIILGRKLWGRPVLTPGPVLYVTAEDQRSLILGRLWRLMQGLNLSSQEIDQVINNFYVIDVRTDPLKLTERDSSGNLKIAHIVNDECIPCWSGKGIRALYLDPLSSFNGGTENSNEDAQVLLAALRRLQAAMGCLITLVHHTGQAVLREGYSDQYSGRGASALSDGCRMVDVLGAMSPADQIILSVGRPTTTTYSLLTRAKSTFTGPIDPIMLAKDGLEIEQVSVKKLTEAEQGEVDKKKIIALITENPTTNYTKRSIRDQHHKDCGVTRQNAMRAVDTLLSENVLTIEPIKTAAGGRKMQRLIISTSQKCTNSVLGYPPQSGQNLTKPIGQTNGQNQWAAYKKKGGGALLRPPFPYFPPTNRPTLGQQWSNNRPTKEINDLPAVFYPREHEMRDEDKESLMNDIAEYEGTLQRDFSSLPVLDDVHREVGHVSGGDRLPSRLHSSVGKQAEELKMTSRHQRVLQAINALTTPAGLTEADVCAAVGFAAGRELSQLRKGGKVQSFKTYGGERRYRGPQH